MEGFIEIKLRDMDYHIYFHGQANMKNKKEFRQLIKDLDAKGISLRKVIPVDEDWV